MPVPVTDIYRVRSRHNRERGSTKKIDGRDFTASYHSNTVGRRGGGGNDRVEAENGGKKVVEIRDVCHARCRGASVHNSARSVNGTARVSQK